MIAGLIPVFAVYYKWPWFMNFHRVKSLYDNLGEIWAKRIYLLLGSVQIIIGILLVLDVFNLESR